MRGIIKQYPNAIKQLNATKSSLIRTEEIPLLIATRNGIEEIVGEIIKKHPHAIEQLNDEEQSILDVAVMHRQEEIFSLVKEQQAQSHQISLFPEFRGRGCCLLSILLDFTYGVSLFADLSI